MHKVNRYHQQVLDNAPIHGLNLHGIRKKYTLPFAIKLFEYLSKETKKQVKGKGGGIEMIYPKKNFTYSKDIDDYIQTLEDAGFKFKTWVEDFIDEDTGEIVGIMFYKFKPLK